MSSVKRTQDSGALFGDHRIAVAAENFESQEQMFAGIRRALNRSGRSVSEVAQELGLSAAEFTDWAAGDYDLALSELRQLANAVDAKIIYTVSPARAAWLQHLTGADSFTAQWVDDEDWNPEDSMRALAVDQVNTHVR